LRLQAKFHAIERWLSRVHLLWWLLPSSALTMITGILGYVQDAPFAELIPGLIAAFTIPSLGLAALFASANRFRQRNDKASEVAAQAITSPAVVERPLVTQDVRYRHDEGPEIGYQHKLLIVLKNESDKGIIVGPAKWQNAMDFISRRLAIDEQVWSPEGREGWQMDSWGKETREPFVVPQGRAIQTWIGLPESLNEIDLRRRIVTKRLGTLTVPYKVNGEERLESIRL
jgi:hypothetical protein